MIELLYITFYFFSLCFLILVGAYFRADHEAQNGWRTSFARLIVHSDLTDENVLNKRVRFLVPVAQAPEREDYHVFYQKWWHRFIKTEKFFFSVRKYEMLDKRSISNEVLAIPKKDVFYLNLCGAIDTTDPRMLIHPIRKGTITPAELFREYVLGLTKTA